MSHEYILELGSSLVRGGRDAGWKRCGEEPGEDGASTHVEALQTEEGENGQLVGENGSLMFSVMLSVKEN